MKIDIIGAGPAGLYFAYLMKQSHPDWRVRVFEQNPSDVTFGFGVVLSERALSFVAQGDESAVGRLIPQMQRWNEQHICVHGQRIVIDGSGYSAISRIALLNAFQTLCREQGVELIFGERVEQFAQRECDVLVGADGANSLIRERYAQAFQTEHVELSNYFAWYGVQRPYDAHTLTFLEHEGGAFCGHHYRYEPSMSTFVAEVDGATWQRCGFEAMSDEQRQVYVAQVFAQTLGGLPLISNKSNWRRWHLVKNHRWHHENIVLIGDALRTAHPSIGSGTRLAFEDAIALWQAFEEQGSDIGAAFALYEQRRRPIRDKLNRAAELSIAWYEDMAAKMRMQPYDFAYDYMLRTGIMTPQRLAQECPQFYERYQLQHP
jgi:2-polyprenyl-6-methoxyphenol hydroxylase-like FAD-dependent oxidoreductase